MGRLAAYDSESLAVLLRRQGGVIRRDQAVTCGLTERALRYRIRPRVAAEVDSREWHLSPAAWEQTMARHARMSACGIIVLHFPPSRIRADRRGAAAEIHSALAAARGRRLPQIRALPSC
jgi:hypothetical protein